jgi:hypothetical protein
VFVEFLGFTKEAGPFETADRHFCADLLEYIGRKFGSLLIGHPGCGVRPASCELMVVAPLPLVGDRLVLEGAGADEAGRPAVSSAFATTRETLRARAARRGECMDMAAPGAAVAAAESPPAVTQHVDCPIWQISGCSRRPNDVWPYAAWFSGLGGPSGERC